MSHIVCRASSKLLSSVGRIEFCSPKVGGLGSSCCWMGKDEGRAGMEASPGEPGLLLPRHWGGTSATSPYLTFQALLVGNAKAILPFLPVICLR